MSPRADGSRADLRFPSKRDTWLVAVIWLSIVMTIGTVMAALPGLRPGEAALALAGSVLLTGFLLSVLYGTHYTFEADVLRIRSGPFNVAVPFSTVRAVTPTRNPLSSPACSLDRLRIDTDTRSIMISPDDRPRFLAMLRERCAALH